MKKLYLLLIPLFSLFFSFPCYASAVPQISNSTFTLIEGGNETLFNSYFLNHNVSPTLPDWNDFSFGFQGGAVLGSDLFSLDQENFTVTALTSDDKELLLDSYEFYSSATGSPTVQLTVNDPIFLAEFDNGYFHGNCYVDINGNVLSSSNDLVGKYLNHAIGGSKVDLSTFNQLYSDLNDELLSNNYKLYESNDVNITDASFYYFWGNVVGGNPNSAGYLYIPNQYNPGVIVPETSSNGASIKYWLCNSSSAYTYKNVLGNFNQLSVTQGTYTKNGITYTMRIGFATSNAGNNLTPNNTYENWINRVNVSNRCFAKEGYFYNSSIEPQKSVTFKTLQVPDGSSIGLNGQDYFDYNALKDLETALNNLTSQVNELFDYTQGITPQNYPQNYPVPSAFPVPGNSQSPLPGGTYQPSPGIVPSIGEQVGDLDQETISNGLPIINNLSKRFPFSIPFDIYNLIQGLSAERETPYIDTTIIIPAINYPWHIQLDLHDFDDIAALFRLLFLITFIGGLAWFSYDHFFGS